MKNKKAVNQITIVFLCIFVFLFFYSLLKGTKWFFDALVAIAALFAVRFYYDRLFMNAKLYVLGFIGLLLHNISAIGILGYGSYIFTIPYDRFLHFTLSLILALLFTNYFIHKQNLTHLSFSIMVILAVLGVGSLLEVIEFVGYYYFGEGEGIFFYGLGDYGEWNNSSLDMVSNFLGAVFGYLLFYVPRIKSYFFE